METNKKAVESSINGQLKRKKRNLTQIYFITKNFKIMQKFIFSILAIGLSTGVFAQNQVGVSAQKSRENLVSSPVKVNLSHMAKADEILYPESFNSCASIEDAFIYSTGQINGLTTGSNQWGDEINAQRYLLSTARQIKGVAAVLTSVPFAGGTTTAQARLYNATTSGIGSQITSTTFSLSTINDYRDEDPELYQFTFTAPQTATNFAVAITLPNLTVSGGSITSDMLIVGSTEDGCATNGGKNAFYYNASEGGWVRYDISDWEIVFDVMIFPILESTTNLNEADLNTLTYVYPNPAKEQVMLASSVKMNKVEIYNIVGQKIYSKDVNGISTSVSTTDFATGQYIVKMYTESGVAVKKMIIK